MTKEFPTPEERKFVTEGFDRLAAESPAKAAAYLLLNNAHLALYASYRTAIEHGMSPDEAAAKSNKGFGESVTAMVLLAGDKLSTKDWTEVADYHSAMVGGLQMLKDV